MTLILHGLAFSALTLIAQAESPSEEVKGPLELTESQMDTVTAGALYVSAEAFASTVGSGGFTYTSTETSAHSGRYMERGIGRAKALACCGPQTSVDVSLAGGADGAIVKEVTNTRIIRTPTYSLAFGWIFVISINPPRLTSRP
jgi:hypothetical protein